MLQGASHPERAIDEWIRVLRPGGRLVVDSRADASALPEPLDNARKSPEYAAIGDRLRFLGGTFEGEPQLLIRISGNFWTRVSPVSGRGSIAGSSYRAGVAGAQPTAQSERIKA